MSVRCQIEIYDNFDNENAGVMLYHHSDGYPEFMLKKLSSFLDASYKYLDEEVKQNWWDAERVGALMIMLSIEDYDKPLLPFSTKRSNMPSNKEPYRPKYGIPVFQPCLVHHGDIDYLYKVYLKENGRYDIKCF